MGIDYAKTISRIESVINEHTKICGPFKTKTNWDRGCSVLKDIQAVIESPTHLPKPKIHINCSDCTHLVGEK